tara:strand:+ start:5186 stop:6160 length:975 start_codon:yes stop_codon:yes gene_type:complete
MAQSSSSATGTYKLRTAEAIRLAVEGNWKAAVAANENILKDFSQDVDAANRLGKAYSELNRPRKAIKAYELALEIDKFNQIARRNIERLQNTPSSSGKGKKIKAKNTATKNKKSNAKKPVSSGLISSSKAADFSLQHINVDVVNDLKPGDKANLIPDNRGVIITSEDGTQIGSIEPRAGLRLRRLIEGGNEYSVAIRSVSNTGNVIVFISETYRAPTLINQSSFLASTDSRNKAPRAYTRRSAVVDDNEPDFYEEDDDQDDSLAELRQLNTNEDSEIELDDDIEIDETADAAMLGVSEEDAKESDEEDEDETDEENEDETDEDY